MPQLLKLDLFVENVKGQVIYILKNVHYVRDVKTNYYTL